MSKHNPDITLRKLFLMTYDHPEYKNRIEFAERDCIIKSIKIKKVTTHSKYRTPTHSLEITSTSFPNYAPYLKKGKTKQRTTRHTYPITMSFFFPKKSDQTITMDTPVQLRTGKGGSWPNERTLKNLNKRIKSKDKPRGKYIDLNDAVAQKYHINGDFYWRQSYIRSSLNCLPGRNYAPASSTTKLFLTKHEIAVLYAMAKQGVIENTLDMTIMKPRGK